MASTVAAAAAAKMAGASSSTRLQLALRPFRSQLSLSSTRAHSTCLVSQLRSQSPALATASARLCRRHYSTESTDSSPSTSSSTSSTSSPTSTPSTPPSPSSSVLERYRSRLDAKAKQEGVGDIEALKQAYADKIRALRQKDAVVMPDKPGEAKAAAASSTTSTTATTAASTRQSQPEAQSQTQAPADKAAPSQTATSAASSPSSSRGGARPLSSMLDLDKARVLPVEELTAIWRLRFAADPLSLCAVIPAQTYAAMEAAARARPQFVLPVPHPEQGAEIHFLQWTFDDTASLQSGGGGGAASTVLFTQVAEYKLRGEFAQPHTTVTHHTDLATDCGVVLMQGQVSEGRGATLDDARWLVMCLQRFYGAWAIPGTQLATDQSAAAGRGPNIVDEGARARRQLLQWFAAGDPQFTVEKLMDEVEKLG